MGNDIYFVWLQMVFGINNNEVFKLLDKFNNPQIIYENRDEIFRELGSRYTKKVNETNIYVAENMVQKTLNGGWEVITFNSEYYPTSLKNIYSPPLVLYASKNFKELCNRFSITVIGTRKPSEYGIAATKHIVSGLVENNIMTVSGLAYGIDRVVHQQTINKNGITIAVLPNGINKTYPSSNEKLRENIMENGAVITEFLYDTMAYKGNFIHRNRILAGLSNGTVITEAGSMSGTLITAKYAFSENREVFCIPSNIFVENSQGTNNLIKNYAKLTTSVNDIIDEYSHLIKPAKNINNKLDETYTNSNIDLDENHQNVMKALNFEPIYIDDIILKTDLSIMDVTDILFYLEMMDLVTSHNGKRYTLKI